MSFLKSVGKLLGKSTSLLGLGSGISKLFDTNQYSGLYQQMDANAAAMRSWNLMNDYNHPLKQMERLKAAGLNPLLVYGSGSVAGNTTSAPSLTGGNVLTESQSMFSGLGNMMSVLQGTANLRQTNAAANASNAAAGASGAQASNLNAQAAFQEIKNDYARDTMIADLDYKKAQATLARKQGRVADVQAKKLSAEADIAQGEADIFGSVGGAKGAAGIGSGLRSGFKAIRGVLKK